MAASINAIPGSSTLAGARGAQGDNVFSLQPGAGLNALLSIVGVSALTIYAFWEMLHDTALEWSQPQYSHGWIIPLIALFILWSRRPNGDTAESAGFRAKAQPAMIVCGVLMVVGKQFGLPLLAGAGLAGLCLAALALCLVGQPFATYSPGEVQANRQPLWIVTAIGSLIVLAGMAAMFGVRLPGLHPGHFQSLGLLFLVLGGLGVATWSEQESTASTAELVFGGLLVGLSLAAWYYAVQIDMMPLVRIAFVGALFGAFTLFGGLRLLQWAGCCVAFLLFMFPLPTVVEGKVLGILQKIAVRGGEAVYTLIGTQVIRRGNQLEVEGIPMEVAQACSGLSMSTILIAMAIAMVLLLNRPWWDKLIVLVLAVPIALLANVFRIVSTGLIWLIADRFFPTDGETTGALRTILHDNAGMLLMMPFALGVYWLVYKVLTMLTVEEQGLESQGPGVLGRGGAPLPQ